jgi:thioredoxin 2
MTTIKGLSRTRGPDAMSADVITLACPSCHRKNRLPAKRVGEAANCGACKSALFQRRPVVLDSASFAAHSQTDMPLVVDFWAPWCGPCRQFAPVFEQAAAGMEPRVRLGKVNTEEQSQLAQQFAIRSIPTLMIFKEGRELARMSGALPPAQFAQWVAQHIQT